MRTLLAAHLSAIDLPPPAFIRAAARAGFDGVGLRLLRVTDDSPGYPLMDDPPQLRDTRAALRETGLHVGDIEFVRITPDTDPAALIPMLDTGAELGARHLICAPYDDDRARLADRLAGIAALAHPRGIRPVLEFFPWTPVPDLPQARAVAAAAGVGVLIDSLHFDRSDGDLAEIAATPAAMLPFVHICDALRHPPYSTQALLHTARAERLPPGDGQIDLRAILRALPRDLPVAAEVPMNALAARDGHAAVLARIATASRALLASI